MATKYFINGGVNNNYTDNTNWSTTSGGANDTTAPTSSDDVRLDGSSPNCVLNATGNALTFVCTGFTGTLSGSSNLTVAGNVTFVAGMTITATGTLTITATATLTSGGKTWTGNLTTPSASSTLTLADNLTISGLVTFPSVAGLATIMNGNILYVSGGLTHGNVNSFSGTTKIIFNGTGTWSSNSSSVISNDIEINTSGTVTFGTSINVSGYFKYTSGTIVVGTSTLRLNGSPTLDVAGINFYNIQTTSTTTVTLLANLTSTNSYNLSGGSATFNGFTLYLAGIAFSNNITLSGTTNVVFNGTGTWSSTNIGQLKSNTTINTFGTLTISGNVYFGTGTLTYTAGTVDASGSTLTITASTTLNTNGITWNNVNISTVTVTNNSILTVNGLLTYISHAVVLNGSDVILNGGFTSNSNSACTGTATIKFKNTGTWVHTSGGSISNNIVFDSGVNTITLGAIVRYATGTITYTSGVIDATTNNSTLSISVSCTLNTNGMSWNNIFVGASLTLNSLLTATGTLTLSNTNITFSGTAGFTVGTLTNTTLTAARTYTLASTKTYTITVAFTSNTNTSTIRPTFRSSVAASQAILTLNAGATQDLKFVNATDIDSSLGQTINSNKAVLSNATNWYRTNGTFMYLMQL